MPQLPKPKIRSATVRSALGRQPQPAPLTKPLNSPRTAPKGSDGGGISPEELKARRRKFLITAGTLYGTFLVGAYYYISYVVGQGGPYEEAKPRDTAQTYDGLAKQYDRIIGRDELFMGLSFWRKDVAKQAIGDVLEISCGTGRNIAYLNIPAVKSITFVDSSAQMVEQTREKFTDRYPKYQHAQFVATRAEDLPLEKKYDTILQTFGLCSHEDPVYVLMHLQDLLKPGGKIVLLEHGRGTWDFVNRILDKSAASRAEVFGCRWNLDIGEIVRKSGLVIDKESRSHFGTTWTIIAHRPGDVMPPEQKKRFLIW
ncbi:S-adenosyl-L-methionine-dependent methyltransferase [Lipomyces kononenkoae]|uniref:S-adenosyl-L-methionine-dependent methyltransferase n=1 Tax=Lipomyces kononenkoae TaxID=34357 RepID=A0ACC3T218_LIPKO